ncbi:MAG: ABC transporter ATP-binding protein [Gemmataceae bacterium]
MQPAIRVKHLSKRFHLGARSNGYYRTFRESIGDAVRGALRRATADGAEPETLWALDDVSFDVARGEVVGVIGRNGAGKSTLLKILSRVVEPAAGRVEIRGRMGSLLEVGTGFHPELTGRENIYLNGSILGMTRREINRKFDEIVAFAEVERFLDTPVKRYSSGMYVRLAFAVASHLETEILVVDEVLAVGDQIFQKKCLSKMDSISRGGRTVLFVSHSMPTILSLCQRVAVLDRGRLAYLGPSEQGVRQYLKGREAASGAEIDLANHPNRPSGKAVVFRKLRILDDTGTPVTQLTCDDRMTLEFEVEPGNAQQTHYAAWVEDSLGTRLFTVGTHLSDSAELVQGRPRYVRCEFGPLMLSPGQYHIGVVAGPIYHMLEDIVEQAATFDIMATDVHGTGRLPTATQGAIVMRSAWSTVRP